MNPLQTDNNGRMTETVIRAKPLRPFPPTNGVGMVVPASNDFGFRLLPTLIASAGPARNVFVSPLSLSLALTMTMDGSGGGTRRQMQDALGYGANAAADVIDSDAASLVAQYRGSGLSPDISASLASGLWSNRTLPPAYGRLSPMFAARLNHVFGAASEAVDFSNASGAQRVNLWTRQKTGGKIAEILPNMPMYSDTALVLTNAMYFKAKWNRHFDARGTVKGLFTLVSKRQKPVFLMSRTDSLSYMKGDGFQATQLPYDDGRFSLIVVLPDPGVNLPALASRQLSSAALWNRSLTQFAPTLVALKLPRFKISYDAGELAGPLKKAGMPAAFDGKVADFRPTGYAHAYIGSVRHKTTLVVDEAGSEATAVVIVELARTTSQAFQHPKPPVIIPFIVDRPFFCAIQDNASGALVFLGAIADPESA